MTDNHGRTDLLLIGERLMTEIILARSDQGMRNARPLILVGHGIGGLVMKELCVRAAAQTYRGHRAMSMFLDSIQGLFFYATPHLGIEGIQDRARNDGRLLRFTHLLIMDSARLQADFCKLWENYPWVIHGVGVTDPTLGANRFRFQRQLHSFVTVHCRRIQLQAS